MGPLSIHPIPAGSRVLLDTVTLVYFLEQHPAHGQAAEAVLRRIEEGEITGLMATLVFAELLVPVYREGETRRARLVASRLTEFRNLEVVVLSPEISMEAARLRAEHGLRTPDAIHGATALDGEADGILTNDRDLVRLEAEGLQVWTFEQLMK